MADAPKPDGQDEDLDEDLDEAAGPLAEEDLVRHAPWYHGKRLYRHGQPDGDQGEVVAETVRDGRIYLEVRWSSGKTTEIPLLLTGEVWNKKLAAELGHRDFIAQDRITREQGFYTWLRPSYYST